MALKVDWVRSQEALWHNFLNINLRDLYYERTEGVYIIWHGGHEPTVVTIGHGAIWDRLIAHRLDPHILHYQRHGLFVTWTQLPPDHRDGVVKYLSQVLTPRNECSVPECEQIGVNLPWEA